MKTDNKRLIILNTVESFFTAWAFMKAGRMEPGNILTGAFFLLSFFLYRHISVRLSVRPFVYTKQVRWSAVLLSFLFTVFYMAIDYPHYIELLTNRLFQAVILFSVFLGFFICFYKLLLLLFSYSADKETLLRLLYKKEEGGIRHLPFYCSVGCLLCWLPYFLYEYPGIMTPDSINQFEQVLHVIPYSNHHPFVHTMIFKLFYQIGFFFTSDMVISVSFYTFFQMCFLAFSIFYFLRTLESFRIRQGILILLALFYAIVPYHAVFSVTLWKDIPFAAVVLLFSCTLMRMLREKTLPVLAMFVFSGAMICLLRSNGWYGFLFCLPFLLFYYRKSAKKVFPALAAILLTAVIVKYPVMNALHVTQPDFVESISIPVQQIAAVLSHDRELSADQRALIEQVIDTAYVKELYNPAFADNMKELVRAGNPDYLSAHRKEFFRLWVELGLACPADYLKAYIDQTYGYWYPDSFYPVADGEGISATDLGVSHTPLIGGPLVIKGKEIALKLGSMLPIYSLLWSMGVVFWFFLFCAGNAFVRTEKTKLICYLPGFALYLTVMIATPVATDFRYVYFMVFSLPFYLMCALISLPEH
ncbi:MAG: DUF6020 family protein [Blautia sp.]|nr:DUF6020 family protein [Blautia sp.]MCM1200471.1 DUF6020 family protein [Bacteroides fragilis]